MRPLRPSLSQSLRALPQRRAYATPTAAPVSAPQAGGTSSPALYCKSLVQRLDYSAFLASYFYPPPLRDGYFALRALNIELATVKDSVSRELIGQMRMQFWRDSIRAVYEGRPPQQPVALALRDAMRRAPIPEDLIQQMIDARDEDLTSSTPPTLESLHSTLSSTSTALLHLQLSLLTPSLPPSLEPHLPLFKSALSHIGLSTGLATLLRALPYNASKRRMVLPADLTAAHGVVQEEVFRFGGDLPGEGKEGLRNAVWEFATEANDQLIAARGEMGILKGERVPREVMPVFLAAVPTQSYLSRLESVDFDAFDPSLQVRHWRLAWDTWRTWRRRDF